MFDISNDLVYIMSESECSSIYALFILAKENNHESDVSAESVPTVYATHK